MALQDSCAHGQWHCPLFWLSLHCCCSACLEPPPAVSLSQIPAGTSLGCARTAHGHGFSCLGAAQGLWGALSTSSMACCALHPCVHPVLDVQCPRGCPHTLSAQCQGLGHRGMAKGPWEPLLGLPGCSGGWHTERGDLGTTSGISLPAVPLFPLLEEPSRSSCPCQCHRGGCPCQCHWALCSPQQPAPAH